MPQPNYQTVKLARGRHSSPESGVCVMELASMLAGEPFTDRPRGVSPVIGSLLRSYNDLVDDRRRQDLFACAARVLGTAGSPRAEAARVARLQEWGEALHARRWWRRLLGNRFGFPRARVPVRPHQAGTFAIHSIYRLTDETHASVLALIDELVAMGPPRAPLPAPSVGVPEEAMVAAPRR